MCGSHGPSESILAPAMVVIKDEKYRDYFKQPKKNDFIDEKEIDDDEDLDPDCVVPHRESRRKILKILLTRNVETLGECSSVESSPKKKPSMNQIWETVRKNHEQNWT